MFLVEDAEMVQFRFFNRRTGAVTRTALCLLLCFELMNACKTPDDATAAASQMATTSQDLVAYYSALTQVMDNTIKLNQLQSALLGTAFGSQDLAQLQETRLGIQQRANLAKTLQSLSANLSKLTGSTAASDVSTSANKLGTELVTVKALPKGPPISTALGDAGQAITLLIKERDERKAAVLLNSTISAVSKQFTAEKQVYESLYATYFALAASLAQESIKRNWVEESSLLTPALQPYGLSPSAGPQAQNLSIVLNSYAEQQIATLSASQVAAQQKATEGMDQALQEMSKRIDELATGKGMHSRGSPVSLADVEAWLSHL